MNKFIVWQTDFTNDWPFVSTMKGVCKQIDPTLEMFDSSHTIDKFNILEASQQLGYIEPFWSNAVLVSVVDPTVGTSRKASVAKLKDGNYVISPDNGSFTHLYYNGDIVEIREIDAKWRYSGTEKVSVFHGRDIFAYTAALLASNKITYQQVGAAYLIDEMVLLDKRYLKAEVNSSDIRGIVNNVSDPFGSIVFNVLTDDFEKYYHLGEMIHVTLKNKEGCYYDEDVLYEKSFGFVELGEPILFNSSSNYISLGLNQSSFKDKYQVDAGLDWLVSLQKQ